MSSVSDLFSSKKNMKRLNKMSRGRLPMLKSSSRNRSDILSWIAGAGVVALVGAGVAYAAKKLGGRSMAQQNTGSHSGSENQKQSRSAGRKKYPTEHATAGGMMPETQPSGHS
ncbi:MAG TPA: hypothetical protein VFG50_06980 [Rhodothermales bacterium]|nr:hypothetical protein [Rhodothermales bacterium]